MTAAAWVAIGAAALFAIGDWAAVVRGDRAREYAFKPLVMIALIVTSLMLDVPGGQRWWFAGALVAGLAGDVFLMLPSDRFIAGLSAFFIAHLAYICGFRAEGGTTGSWLVVVVVLGLAGLPLTIRIVGGAGRVRGAVASYVGVITLMGAAALVSGDGVAVAGAALFFFSDAVIGWSRFVRASAWMPLGIITTYHLGQILLVASLAT